MFKILVVEDDSLIRQLIVKHLSKNGYDPLEAENGKKAIELFESQHIDLIVTDIMMPLLDGNMLTRKIRLTNSELPILMLTALDQFADKEKGFSSGADDYMVKPIEFNEMMLRIKALLRRYQIMSQQKIELKTLSLNYQTGECIHLGKHIELTRKEFLLLFKLLASPNMIFTREQLMNEIWGYDSESYDRTVDTHIKRIREQIESPDFEIITVRGLGYKAVLK